MALEIIHWLQDVCEHLWVSQRRKTLRQPGQGFDYTGDKYRDVVRRIVSAIHPQRMRLRVLEIIQETPTTKTFRFERNLWFCRERPSLGPTLPTPEVEGVIGVDPQLVDPANGDFGLRPGGPAAGKGHTALPE